MPPATAICPIFRVHFINILNKLASSLHPVHCALCFYVLCPVTGNLGASSQRNSNKVFPEMRKLVAHTQSIHCNWFRWNWNWVRVIFEVNSGPFRSFVSEILWILQYMRWPHWMINGKKNPSSRSLSCPDDVFHEHRHPSWTRCKFGIIAIPE